MPRGLSPLFAADQSYESTSCCIQAHNEEPYHEELYSPPSLALSQVHGVSSIDHVPSMLFNFQVLFTLAGLIFRNCACSNQTADYPHSLNRVSFRESAIISSHQLYPSDNIVQDQEHSMTDRRCAQAQAQSQGIPSRAIQHDPVVALSQAGHTDRLSVLAFAGQMLEDDSPNN